MANKIYSDAEIEKRFKKLDRPMQIYFKQKTMQAVADMVVEENEQYNRTKKWWQKRKNTTPSSMWMPDLMPVGVACFHPQFKMTEKLIDDYIASGLAQEGLSKPSKKGKK